MRFYRKRDVLVDEEIPLEIRLRIWCDRLSEIDREALASDEDELSTRLAFDFPRWPPGTLLDLGKKIMAERTGNKGNGHRNGDEQVIARIMKVLNEQGGDGIVTLRRLSIQCGDGREKHLADTITPLIKTGQVDEFRTEGGTVLYRLHGKSPPILTEIEHQCFCRLRPFFNDQGELEYDPDRIRNYYHDLALFSLRNKINRSVEAILEMGMNALVAKGMLIQADEKRFRYAGLPSYLVLHVDGTACVEINSLRQELISKEGRRIRSREAREEPLRSEVVLTDAGHKKRPRKNVDSLRALKKWLETYIIKRGGKAPKILSEDLKASLSNKFLYSPEIVAKVYAALLRRNGGNVVKENEMNDVLEFLKHVPGYEDSSEDVRRRREQVARAADPKTLRATGADLEKVARERGESNPKKAAASYRLDLDIFRFARACVYPDQYKTDYDQVGGILQSPSGVKDPRLSLAKKVLQAKDSGNGKRPDPNSAGEENGGTPIPPPVPARTELGETLVPREEQPPVSEPHGEPEKIGDAPEVAALPSEPALPSVSSTPDFSAVDQVIARIREAELISAPLNNEMEALNQQLASSKDLKTLADIHLRLSAVCGKLAEMKERFGVSEPQRLKELGDAFVQCLERFRKIMS